MGETHTRPWWKGGSFSAIYRKVHDYRVRSLTGQRDTAKGDAQRMLKQLLHATGDVAPTAGGEIAATGADNALAFNPRDLRVQRSGLRREVCDLTHGEAANALQTQSAARVDAPLAGAFTLRRARSPAHGQACAVGRACALQTH